MCLCFSWMTSYIFLCILIAVWSYFLLISKPFVLILIAVQSSYHSISQPSWSKRDRYSILFSILCLISGYLSSIHINKCKISSNIVMLSIKYINSLHILNKNFDDAKFLSQLYKMF